MRETDPLDSFVPFTKAVVAAQPHIAYVHAIESLNRVATSSEPASDTLDTIRAVLLDANVKLIVTGGYATDSALEQSRNTDDLIGFAHLFVSNPDLPKRIQNSWPLGVYDRKTFYTQTAEGYVDYSNYAASHPGAVQELQSGE